MLITDNKSCYEDFKLFKTVYTRLKVFENITIYGDNENIYMVFPKSQFYIPYGEMLLDSEFMRWIKTGKFIEISIDDIKDIKSCLKKNCISLEYDENSFIFTFKDKDENIIKKEYKNIEDTEFRNNIVLQRERYLSKFNNERELSDDFFKDELFKIYLDDNNNLVPSRTSVRILDIPLNKLLSYQANSKCFIDFSDRNIDDTRYILFKSISEELSLYQIFLTI